MKMESSEISKKNIILLNEGTILKISQEIRLNIRNVDN
jgi:hypothetical protein